MTSLRTNVWNSKDHMSNFTPDQFEHIMSILKSCNDLGIKSIIFEQYRLRAATEDRTAVIVKQYDAPLFSGVQDYVIAMSRVGSILGRLQLVPAKSRVQYSLQPSDNKPYYKVMSIDSKSHKFDIRFADPDMLTDEVPRGLKGAELFTIAFSDEDVKNIKAAARVFGPDNVWLHVTPSGVRIEMVDPAVGEKISIQITDSADISDVVGYKYATDVFIKLLNQTGGVNAVLFSNGLLRVNYNGIDVHLLRRQG